MSRSHSLRQFVWVTMLLGMRTQSITFKRENADKALPHSHINITASIGVDHERSQMLFLSNVKIVFSMSSKASGYINKSKSLFCIISILAYPPTCPLEWLRVSVSRGSIWLSIVTNGKVAWFAWSSHALILGSFTRLSSLSGMNFISSNIWQIWQFDCRESTSCQDFLIYLLNYVK